MHIQYLHSIMAMTSYRVTDPLCQQQQTPFRRFSCTEPTTIVPGLEYNGKYYKRNGEILKRVQSVSQQNSRVVFSQVQYRRNTRGITRPGMQKKITSHIDSIDINQICWWPICSNRNSVCPL